MKEERFTIPSFQTFYVSKEESNCSLMPEIIKIGKKFKDLELLDNIASTSISMKYGKRIIINSKDSNIGDIKREDFLELVDYDPVKKVLLTLGPKEPRIESSIHWLIHHARDEVNAVIQINDEILAEKLSKKIPVTEKEWHQGTLEQAKEILKILRDSKNVVIKNQGVVFVGENIKDVEENLLKTFEGLK